MYSMTSNVISYQFLSFPFYLFIYLFIYSFIYLFRGVCNNYLGGWVGKPEGGIGREGLDVKFIHTEGGAFFTLFNKLEKW